MKLNEAFDDEVGDDELTVESEKPLGDFTRMMADRKVWFNSPLPGQFHAWKRYRDSLQSRYKQVRNRAEKNPTNADLRDLMKISEKFDLSTLELVESLIVLPEDVEYIQLCMISNKIGMSEIVSVLFGEDDGVEDDAEPAVRVRKTPVKKKSVANATRVKK